MGIDTPLEKKKFQNFFQNFFADSSSLGQSEQRFLVAFFILSPTSCRNLRFSCKKCQKQPKMGTKIAKNDFFQKILQNLDSPSSI